jgi:hypothetical protein
VIINIRNLAAAFSERKFLAFLPALALELRWSAVYHTDEGFLLGASFTIQAR